MSTETKEVPRRRIIKTTPRNSRRYSLWGWLECGHLEPMTKKEAKTISGSICFDCFYGKPKVWDGEMNDEQQSQTSVSDSRI